MYWIIVILLSFAVGSFFTVVLVRFEKSEGIVRGRSRCQACRHVLTWSDLIPIISFIWLGGRCRYCRVRISPLYLAVELATVASVALFVWQNGFFWSWNYAVAAIMLLGFILLIFFDYMYFILPDIVTLPLILLAAVMLFSASQLSVKDGLITGFSLAAFFAILYIVSAGRWIGFGDVKLAMLIGLFFGYPLGLAVVFSAIWLAALVGIVLVITKRLTLKSRLPLGSFMAASALMATIFLNELSRIAAKFL